MARSLGIWGLIFGTLVTLLTVGCAQRTSQVSSSPTQMEATGPSAEEIRAREEAERRRRIAESQLASGPTRPTPGTSVLDSVYFGFDEATLSDQAKNTLVRDAEWLRTNADVRVQVEGHCDDRGTAEYNLALGERRAEAAKSYLSSLGIDVSRMRTISYGKERPVDAGHTEGAWAKNRRVEFKAM
jgi:peptidoglycan-associated lipoprotein